MRAKANYLGARWDDATQLRFWSKVEKHPGGCWEWIGTTAPNGYGRFPVDNRCYSAHRLLLVKLRGDAFDGLVCDHLCRNRKCVNPDHLEIVTNRQNILRGDAPILNTIRGMETTHCRWGHAYTPENTRYNRYGRTCRACDRIRTAKWNAKRKTRRIALSTPSMKDEDDD